jgi:hypothetical protein
VSLRKAIDAKCRECIYDPIGGGGTWRQQVHACTSYRCPLYPVRPLSEASGIDRNSQVQKPANSGPLQTVEAA